MSTKRPRPWVPATSRGPGTGRVTNHELREAAARLVDEHPDLPPGSVLRCFSRSVRIALLTGYPAAQVVVEAERLARDLLSQRCPASDGGHQYGIRTTAPRVPQPRRAS